MINWFSSITPTIDHLSRNRWTLLHRVRIGGIGTDDQQKRNSFRRKITFFSDRLVWSELKRMLSLGKTLATIGQSRLSSMSSMWIVWLSLPAPNIPFGGIHFPIKLFYFGDYVWLILAFHFQVWQSKCGSAIVERLWWRPLTIAFHRINLFCNSIPIILLFNEGFLSEEIRFWKSNFLPTTVQILKFRDF